MLVLPVVVARRGAASTCSDRCRRAIPTRLLVARRSGPGATEGPWEAARIEAGVPVGGREVTESTIAAEVGLVDRTVSFTKGCFTGQELVARLDARGSKVARRLWGLVVAAVGPADRSGPTVRTPRRRARGRVA